MKQNILKAAILAAGFCCTVGCSDNDSDLTIYIPDAGTAVKANFYIEDERSEEHTSELQSHA